MDASTFLKSWIKFTIYGWLVGFALVICLAFLSESLGLGESQFFIGLGIGAGVGYMQGRVLKLYFKVGYSWLITTCLGMGLAFVLFDFGHNFTGLIPAYNLLYSVSLGGFFVAASQYFVLKNRITKALWWIPICWISWTIAGGFVRISETTESLGLTGLPAAVLVLLILTVGASGTLGALSGFGLTRMILANE